MEILTAIWIAIVLLVGIMIFKGQTRSSRQILKDYRRQRQAP